MRRPAAVCLALASVAACAGFDPAPGAERSPGNDGGPTPKDDSGTPVTPGPDAGAPLCDPTAPFKNKKQVGGVHADLLGENEPTLSEDELSIYFGRNATGRILVAIRANIDQDFSNITEVELAAVGAQYAPSLSPDGLRLAFQTESEGRFRIAVARRKTTTETFVGAEVLTFPAFAGVKSDEAGPKLTADTLYFTSAAELDGSFTPQLAYRAALGATGAQGAPSLLLGLEDTKSNTGSPALTRDGKYGIFHSHRAHGGPGGELDLFRAKRDDQGRFTDITQLDELNTSANEYAGWLSPDNCRFYYASGDGDMSRIYLATR